MTEQQLAAVKKALEALESCGLNHGYMGDNQYFDDDQVDKAITALQSIIDEQALAQPADESAESADYDMIDHYLRCNLNSDEDYAKYSAALDRIYTHPQALEQPAEWVGLMRGVRVDGDYVMILAKTNGAARELCNELVKLIDKNTAPQQGEQA